MLYEIDTRPHANDITLCLNSFCENKCKRFHENWQPSEYQSYINPSVTYDEFGFKEKCKLRME